MKTLLAHLAITAAALALFGLMPTEAQAACTDNATGTPVWASVNATGNYVRFTGDCTEDDEVLIWTNDVSQYDACVLMSTTGAVDVLVSLDGTNFSTAALSLQDFGAEDTVPVLVTVALRVYGFVGKFRAIKVLENGTTDAAASLNCWKF